MQTVSPPPLYEQPAYYPSPVHEYHVQGWNWFRLLNGACAFACSLWVLVDSAWRHDRLGVIVVLGSIACIALGTLQTASSRLVVSPFGITYHQSGSALFVAWEDMVGIGPPPRRGFGVTGGIVTRHAAWQHPRWKLWARRDPFILLRTTQGRYWQQGVGDELAYYAPWLYDAMPLEWRTYHRPLL